MGKKESDKAGKRKKRDMIHAFNVEKFVREKNLETELMFPTLSVMSMLDT